MKKLLILGSLGGCVLLVSTVNADEQSNLITNAAQEISVGPLKLTFGPQKEGELGALLRGSGHSELDWLNDVPAIDTWDRPFKLRYGSLEYDVDAGWSSAPNALNQSSISIKPAVTFIWHTAKAPPKQQELTPAIQTQCTEVAQLRQELSQKLVTTTNLEIRKTIKITLTQAKDESDRLGCTATVGDPPKPRWALSAYPDFLYRFGKVESNGIITQQNQLLVGVATRIFLSSATRSEWFREGPRITAGYYSVEGQRETTPTIHDGLEPNTIRISGRLAMRPPSSYGQLGKFMLDADITGSRPTSGASKDWTFVRTLQIAYNTGTNIKPALTYRSGTDQGLQYDKQFILGLVWDLASRSETRQ